MTKARATIIAIISIIAGGIYVADEYLNIDIMEMIFPDSKAPVIDTSGLILSAQLNGTLDYSSVTCEDDKDEDCEIVIVGTIDTSVLGEHTITFTATDEKGNKSEKEVTITIIEGVDPSLYIPAGYYDALDGVSDEQLKSVLNDIITGHDEFPYTDKDLDDMDVWKMLRAADEDPENSDNVIMFYLGESIPKDCQDTNTSLLPDHCFEDGNRDNDYTEWNREHIWSKSHGDFEEEDEYEYEDTFGGYALGAHTDGHHLVASERPMNSTKNNRFFDDCHDGLDDDNLVDRGYGNYTCGSWYFEPRDEVKGDVARMLFYMAVRYEGEDGDYVDLELTTDLYQFEDSGVAIKNSKLPYYEKLDVLLRWHLEDPVDEWEINRNNVIYGYQNNRNPFIDMPELVEKIWGKSEDYN